MSFSVFQKVAAVPPPPPIRIKITPPLSYRPRLLAIGKLKFRIKPLNYVFLVSLCLSMVILAYPDARGKNQDLGGLFLTVYAQFDRNPCFSDKFSTVTQKKIGPRRGLSSRQPARDYLRPPRSDFYSNIYLRL